MSEVLTKVTKHSYIENSEPKVSEIVEMEALDSVEISLGAKGNVTFSVKCYDNDIDKAKERANKTFRGLQGTYPSAQS